MRAEFNQDKIDEMEKAERGIPTAELDLKDNDSLMAYLDSCWADAKSAKEGHAEAQILSNMRQIDGEYDSAKISAIKEIGGSEVFMMITDAKAKNAANWVEELLFQPNQKPWDLSPTPVPELPEFAMQEIYREALMEVMDTVMSESQQVGMPPPPNAVQDKMRQIMPAVMEAAKDKIFEHAKKLSENMSKEVDDKLVEGGWYAALKQCLPNIVMHTGFITGPIPKKRPSIKIKPMPNGKMVAHIVDDIIPTWESRHPLNIYPAPDATNLNDGYLFDRIRLTPLALQELIGVDTYDEDEIREVLQEAKDGKLYEWISVDQEKADVDDTPSPLSYDSKKIDCLKFMGSLSGEQIAEWGKSKGPDGKKIDKDLHYNVIAYKIGKHIISIQYNKDPLGRKPYYKASFEEIDGSFWGKGLPQIIKDVQSVCNAMARAIVNNAGIGSGPQVERNIDRIPPAQRTDNRIIPWRVWDVTGDMMASPAPALKFYQPPMVVERLLQVYTTFSKIADEHSGVPAFAHGDPNVGGAGNALANYENILTPNGPTEISKINIGDEICNTYGSFSKVTGVYPQGESDIYRVRFSNCEYVDCDLNHRWSVKTHIDRKFRTLTTAEILGKGLHRKAIIGFRNPRGSRPKWMLPMVDCLEFSKKDIKIDPYTMGCLLGDGDSRGRLTSMDQEIFDRIPYALGKIDKTSNGRAWTRTIKGVRIPYRSYGLECKSISKFIPNDYLYNTKEIRLELLRGLMDTDGCCTKAGETFYSTSSQCMSKDFVKLVKSLGATVRSIREEDGSDFEIKGRQCTRQKNYRIAFNLSWEKIFHLDRKQSRTHEFKKTHVYIEDISYIGKNDATCISVNSKDELFVVSNCICTHNTASGLSMLMGSAARGIKAIIKSIDEYIIKPSVERQYVWMIEREDYYGMICDYQIVSGGTLAALAREQMAARRIEFMNSTANPVDAQIMGMEGRKYVIEETAKSVNMDLTRIMPKTPSQPPMQPGQPGQDPNQPMSFGQEPGMAQSLDAAGSPVAGQDNRSFNTPRG